MAQGDLTSSIEPQGNDETRQMLRSMDAMQAKLASIVGEVKRNAEPVATASEVRSLAQRSAQAAREIKGLIGTSVDRVEHGSSLVDDAGRTMDQATQQNAALVEQSAAAADSLKQQAQQLVQAVSAFRLR